MITFINQCITRLPFFKRIYPSLLNVVFKILKKEKFIIKFKNIYLRLNIQDPIDKLVFYKNAYEEKQINFLCKWIKNENPNIFLDIGANFGIYSLRISKLFKHLKILAFEPIPTTFKRLMDNIRLNKLKKIKAHQIGISNTNGLKRMIALKRKGYVQSGGYSFNIPKRKIAEDEVMEYHKSAWGDKILKFKNKKIVLKIDVEGYERKVLLGIKNVLKNNKVLIQIEIFDNNFKRINSLLLKYKYKLINHFPKSSDYYYTNI